MGFSFGGGSSGGSQQTQLTQEQKDLLKAQTGFLTQTAFPAYQQTIGQAANLYGQVSPTVEAAARNASNVAGQTGAAQVR